MSLKQIAWSSAAGLVILGLGFWFGNAFAATNEPGSAGDPLVSKSYVDALLQFQVVSVPRGSSLVGEGGTEMVLRAGQATAIASDQGGILDLSDGVDLPQGAVAKSNHGLVVPRTDGRGILAKTDIIVMVKGPYTVKAGN